MDLYSENILEHYKHPSNKGVLESPDASAEEVNPLCGDKIRMDLAFGKNGEVCDVKFSGEGCAISQASASMLSEELQGKSREELLAISNQEIYDMLGVSISPARVKCALLSLVTLKKAIIINQRT